MTGKIAKIASVSLIAAIIAQPAFAMSDYKNIYKIDYMDEVFRFDTGDLLEGLDASEDENSPYDYYMEVLKSFGIDLYDESGRKTHDSHAEYSDLYGAIASLVSSDSDFIENYKSGNFAGNITMREALGFMADMLGYAGMREEMSIESIAYKEGLLKGVSYSGERYITIGELAVMIWNTLNANGVEMSLSSNMVTYRDADDSLMERQLDVYEISGFLNAANGVNVYKNSYLKKGYVEIDRAGYISGNSGAEKYLGKRVKAYIRGDEDDDRTIVFLTEEESSENITIDMKSIESAGTYLEYETAEGKTKRADIRNLEYVLYNGDSTKDLSILVGFDDMDGNITLSSTERSGKYDVAVINAYEYFVVHSVDTHERRIYLRDNAKFKGVNYIDIPEDELVFCTSDDKEVSFEELLTGQSIRVIQNSSKTYTDIQASSATVTGKIVEFDRNSGIIKVNDTEYRISKTYENNPGSVSIKFNSFGTFYVSKDKYVAGFKDGNEAVYGFLKRIIFVQKTGEVQATVFTQMGKWETFILKEKINLNGLDDVDAKKAADTINDNNDAEKLIRYKINGANKITFIDTMSDEVTEIDDDKRIKLAYEGTVKQSWQGGRWFRNDMGYRILNDSPVFSLPKNLEKTEDYSIKTGANLNNDEKDIYIKLYTADEIGICEVAIISEQADVIGEDTPYWFYCEKVGTVWNEDDQVSDYVMIGARVTSSTLDCSEDFEVKVSADKREKLEAANPGAVGKGAFMKLTYDTDGYMSAAEVAFTNATLPDEFWDPSNTSYYQYFCGTVTHVDAERGYIVVNATTKKKEFPLHKILCIDSSDYSARTISIGELRVGEKMYVYKSGGWGRVCVIVR